MSHRSIDLAQWVGAIKRAHGSCWHNDPGAYARASGVWGGGANPHGVFLAYEKEMLVEGSRSWEATAYLARSPSGMWAMGTSHRSSFCGSGRAPSIWQEVAFPSRQDARRAAALELAQEFERLAARLDRRPAFRSEALSFVEALMAIAEPAPKQLCLF